MKTYNHYSGIQPRNDAEGLNLIHGGTLAPKKRLGSKRLIVSDLLHAYVREIDHGSEKDHIFHEFWRRNFDPHILKNY